MNRKRWTNILMGAVCGVMFMGMTMASKMEARTAFVCEGRIGNAAINPSNPLSGDFEYDIGTNTAAPSARGQFGWLSSNAVPFTVIYDANERLAKFQLGGGELTFTLNPDDFLNVPNAVANLNFRLRAIPTGSNVTLTNLTLHVSTQPSATLEAAFGPAHGNGEILTNMPGVNLQGRFRLEGNAIVAWVSSNPPARSQLAFQISADEPDVDIDVDVNRDGTVNHLDKDHEDQWSVERGAFVAVNQWAAFYNLSQLSSTTIDQLAPIQVRRTGFLPQGYSVRVSAETNQEVSLIYRDSASSSGFSRADLSVGSHVLDPNVIANSDIELYLAAHFDLGHYETKDAAIVTLKLQLVGPSGVEVSSDIVEMQVAPIALAWNSLVPEQLYCASRFPNLPGTEDIRTEYDNYVDLALVPWMQDFMEFGLSQTTEMSGVNQLLDLNDPRNGSQFLDQNFVADGNQWHMGFWNNGGHGGNIEVFPPYSDANNVNYPLGRVIMGSKHAEIADRIARQRLQSPVVLYSCA